MLSEGRGIDIDKKEATEYMKKAANKGNIYAMHLYGLMLYNGDWVTQNKKETDFYFKKAGMTGNLDSLFLYDRMLTQEGGIEMNM